jgi:hypothetical protein
VKRKLHGEELHNFYFSVNFMMFKSRRMRWVGHAERVGELNSKYNILVGSTDVKRSLLKHKRR